MKKSINDLTFDS